MENLNPRNPLLDRVEIREYQQQIIDAVIQKIQSGAKRVMFALPVGCGKTFILKKLAVILGEPDGSNVVFITGYKASAEQIKYDYSDNHPKAQIVTFHRLERSPDDYLNSSKIVFVDDLHINARRALSNILEHYDCSVISSTSYPFGSQEVR